MSVTAEDFAKYLNQGAVEAGMDDALATATAAVDEYVRANVPSDLPVPTPILDQAVIEAASNLWDRRNAPGGQLTAGYADPDVGAPVRVSRDLLAPVRPLLAQWVTPLGFA